jgi:hypothetical protein
MLLASVILSKGRMRAATEQMKLAATMLPDDPALVNRVAQALTRLGETNAARALPAASGGRKDAFRTDADRARARLPGTRAQCAGAAAHGTGARDGYDNADFRYFRALQLQFNGRMERPKRKWKVACAWARRTGVHRCRWRASAGRPRSPTMSTPSARGCLRSNPAANTTPRSNSRCTRSSDDLGQLDDAWAGTGTRERGDGGAVAVRRRAEERLFDRIIERFDTDFLAKPGKTVPWADTDLHRRHAALGHDTCSSASSATIRSSPPPGNCRTFRASLRWVADCHGHPLLDDALLDALPQVDFAEVGRRYLEQSQWRANGRPYYVDKLPPNFMLVGCIRRALPAAKVVHMVREPMDVCFSNYRAMFGDAYSYAYDFDRLAHHHRQYQRLMQHWRQAAPGFVLDLRTPNSWRTPEATCRKLLEFCGLPYEAACLDHTRNTASVATLSSAQVRQPIPRRQPGRVASLCATDGTAATVVVALIRQKPADPPAFFLGGAGSAAAAEIDPVFQPVRPAVTVVGKDVVVRRRESLRPVVAWVLRRRELRRLFTIRLSVLLSVMS